MTSRLSGSRRWPKDEMGKCEVIFERALRAFELADEVAVKFIEAFGVLAQPGFISV